MDDHKILNERIKSYFFLENQKFDGIIQISMEGSDKNLLELVMNKIYFELNPQEYEFKAYAPLPNNQSLERKIFFRRISKTI